MADFDKEHYQHKGDKPPIDHKFEAQFNEGDNVNPATIVVTCPTGVSEATALRVVSGQTVQCAFDTSGATVGAEYIVSVKATSVAGFSYTLRTKIIVTE